ncbi:MAG: chemotaxis protein CheA [Spirochaetota bacterium]
MDTSKFGDTYREEAFELIALIEQKLIDLERAPTDRDTIDSIFRALHTIKGSGAMFGFTRISSFTHEFEALFDGMRKGAVTANKDIIDCTLSAVDHISRLLRDEDVPEAETGALIERLRSQSGVGTEKKTAPAVKVQAEDVAGVSATYRIQFKPAEDIFKRGVNLVPIFDELRRLGNCLISAHALSGPLDEVDPESCYSAWTMILSTDKGENAIRDAFIFVEDYSEIRIETIDREGFLTAPEEYKKIGDILVERGDITVDELEEILAEKKLFGEIALAKGYVTKAQLDSALVEQKYVRTEREKRRDEASRATIRVKSEKLDSLVNLVGELVTLQARIAQTAGKKKDPEFRSLAEALERLANELRENSMMLRMVPVDEMFKSFHRLVRDLSQELNKDVELVTKGTETELDKNVIESLKDPLMHIIRNSIDHGLETPGERTAHGKEAKGTVTLSASHEGAHVLISVTDDGAGLNRSKILKKAMERGLVKEGTDLTAREVHDLIFLPGFSTAEKATSVSGRGVGMDVVKRNVEKLRGVVEIDTKQGEGTTINLRIPLTLAIVDGLLARVGTDHFILNLSNVDECVDLTEEILATGNGSSLVNIRGELIPYINLREKFEIAGAKPEIERMLVTKNGEGRVGLVVDDVMGQHQTVIKTLGSAFKGIDEVTGATILGDGTVALILDVNTIIRKEIVREEAMHRAAV